jgi:hypothetical protein
LADDASDNEAGLRDICVRLLFAPDVDLVSKQPAGEDQRAEG